MKTKKIIIVIILLLVIFPQTVNARTCDEKYPGDGLCVTETTCPDGFSEDNEKNLCLTDQKCCHQHAMATKLTLQVPLLGYTEASNITEYIGKIYQASLYIIIPFIIVMIIFSGLLWALAAGDKSIIQKAKSRLIYSFIGLGIALFSYVILSVVGITQISSIQVSYISPIAIQNQWDLSYGDSTGIGVGGKNAQEICQNIMKKQNLVQVYKNAETKSGIEWEIFAGIHYRERNNATSSNPFQFDSRVNKYGKRAECRVWPGAIDCVISFIKSFGTNDPVLIPRYYNCGRGCRLPTEYFYTHNDPDTGKIFRIKGTLENGQRVNTPDKRPGAVVIYNALKNNCGGTVASNLNFTTHE